MLPQALCLACAGTVDTVIVGHVSPSSNWKALHGFGRTFLRYPFNFFLKRFSCVLSSQAVLRSGARSKVMYSLETLHGLEARHVKTCNSHSFLHHCCCIRSLLNTQIKVPDPVQSQATQKN